MKQCFVLDTCTLQSCRTDSEWRKDVGKAERRLNLVHSLWEAGTVYCIPQVIKELHSMQAEIERRMRERKQDETMHSFYERFMETKRLCETATCRIEDMTKEAQWIYRYAFEKSKMHNHHLPRGKVGSALETDKHLLAMTVALGTQGETTLVTRDTDLEKSYLAFVPQVLTDMAAHDVCPGPFFLYYPSVDTQYQEDERVRVPRTMQEYVDRKLVMFASEV